MIEFVRAERELLAIILPNQYRAEGIEFFTPRDFSQQLAYMNRPAGYVIEPHAHNAVTRQVLFTSEVLFVKSGRVRVDFFDASHAYLESRVIVTGDVILLVGGGHGFLMLEDSELIEVKQGPYAGEADKTRFAPVEESRVRLSTTGT